MRRSIKYLLFAIILSWSCTKTVPIVPGAEDRRVPLVFSMPVANLPTKADPENPGAPNKEIPVGYDKAEHMSVYALDYIKTFAELTAAEKASSFNLMNNVDCGYNASLDCWDPSSGVGGVGYYWPYNTDARVTFQAYSPSAARNDMTISHSWDTGFSFTGFTVRAAGSQYDLMVTARHIDRQRSQYTEIDSTHGNAYDDETDATYTYNGVDLLFSHTLSLIKFSINPGYDEGASAQQILLKEISVLNAYESGDYAQSLTVTGDGHPGTPTWSNVGSPQNYKAFDSASGYELHSGWNTDGDAGFAACTNVLMLVPQPLLHSSGGNIQIRVVYSRVSGAVETTHTAEIDLATGNGGTYFVDDITSTPISAWESGKRYTYKLNLGLHKVFIDPDVDAWTAGGGSNIDI